MKIKMLTALSLLFVFLSVAAGAFAGATIVGTAHDLSSTGAAGIAGYGNASDATNRICIYCHAPHHTIKGVDAAGMGFTYVPLWNHDITTQSSFTFYSNGGNPQDTAHSAPTSFTIGSVSKLCLSCHDGSIATAAYGNAGGVSATASYALQQYSGDAGSFNKVSGSKTLMNSGFNIGAGGDLSNHHPIGFNYQTAYQQHLADSSLNNPDTATLATNLTVTQALSNTGTMECNTCHSVHDTGNTGEMFLWKSDAQSALCLTCHNK